MKDVKSPRVDRAISQIERMLDIRDESAVGQQISRILEDNGLSAAETRELTRRLTSWPHPVLAVELSLNLAILVKDGCSSFADIAEFIELCQFSNIQGVRTNILPTIRWLIETQGLSIVEPSRMVYSYVLEACYSPSAPMVRIEAARCLLSIFAYNIELLDDAQRISLSAAARYLWTFGGRILRREVPDLKRLLKEPYQG